MSLVAVINLAQKVYRVTKRFSKVGTRYDPGSRFAEHFPPNYRPYAKLAYDGSQIAFSGGLIANAIEEFNYAIQPSKTTKYVAYKKRQARDNMVKPRSGYKRWNKCPPYRRR